MGINILSNVGESRYKLIILSILTLAALFIAINVNVVLGLDVIYTHLFYIPIIIAGIWFHKKAVYVALFLGAFHILINYAVSGTFIYGTFFRAAFFLLIAYIVGAIAEKKDYLYAELKTSENQLRQMRNTLEQRVRERTGELNAINESLKKEIAERTNVEKALKKSRAILARAQSIAHVGNWAWDLKAGKQQWSDEVFRIFGRQPQDFQPTVDWLISSVHPEDRELVHRTMEEALHENKLFNIDYRIVLSDGSIRGVNSVADKYRRDPDGNPIWLYGIIQDITGRKRVEDERLRLANRIILLLDSTGEGIYGIDLDGRCTFINRSAAKMLGYTPEEVLGKGMHKLFHYRRKDGSPYPEDECPNVRTMKYGHGYRISDEVFWRRDGTSFPVEYSSYPIIDKGVIQGAVIVFDDITERKQAEEALLESKSQAELYVDIMAHDISNIDQAIMGYLELALDTLNINEKQKELIAEPIELVKSSTRLIENVKKLQRLKAGEIPRIKVDVGRALSEVIAEYSHVQGRHVEINYRPITGCMVMANALLKDLFSNIVGNAVKHSKGPLIINITVSKTVENGREYCRVDIEDNGPGISDELKKKLFKEPRKDKVKAERRGLGLQLVNVLVQIFEGKVWAEDRVPQDHTKGVRFVVMLPIVE
jgi:PAS domain S-box-containing protein